jgi:hypothetical protein
MGETFQKSTSFQVAWVLNSICHPKLLEHFQDVFFLINMINFVWPISMDLNVKIVMKLPIGGHLKSLK